jgi:hypothetical protein
MRIHQRLSRLEACFPPGIPKGDPERGEQMVNEIRTCLGGFGIDFDRLVEDMDAKFGHASNRMDFFIRFGLALAEQPEAKEAVSARLHKHILRSEARMENPN